MERMRHAVNLVKRQGLNLKEGREECNEKTQGAMR